MEEGGGGSEGACMVIASSTLDIEMERKTETETVERKREKMKNNKAKKKTQFKNQKREKKGNEYHVSYVNVCKRSHTSTKLDICEYHELWLQIANTKNTFFILQ